MDQSLQQEIINQGKRAKKAALILGTLSGEVRQKAINSMISKLTAVKEPLLQANKKDIADAHQNGLSKPMIKRLLIDEKVFQYMLKRLEEIYKLPDPLNKILEGHKRPNGLTVQRVSVPLGVIAMIYEARPTVTIDAASVCIKSGNAVILRGGSEAFNSNLILAEAMIDALRENQIPEDAIQMIRSPGHEAVDYLLKLDEFINVLIPRGGKDLIKRISEGTRIPVIKHYEGICHCYLADDAEEDMAISITVNSKCQSVEVCNALETLLVDVKSAHRLLPKLYKALTAQGIELRGCDNTRKIISGIKPAVEEDWRTEYLAPILSVRIVDGIDQAIEHINMYGSGHTDVIVTQDIQKADQFIRCIDSASVLVNASTRISGGGDYGLGAVVGISTDKIHARGPVGPDNLTSYKWVVYGNGHLRE